jgi:O-antigen/teichoic acid export membrane protein
MFVLLGGRIVQVLLTIAQIRLATTLLTPAQYGIWILIQTSASLYTLFGISPFGLYLNRHIIEWQGRGLLPQAFKGYSGYIALFSAVMTVMTLLLTELGILHFAEYPRLGIALLVCVLMFCQTFHQTWLPGLNFLGDRRGYVVGSVMGIFLALLAAFGLGLAGKVGVEWWVLSVSFGFLTSTIILIPRGWFSRSGTDLLSFFRTISFKDVAAFAGPLFLTTVFLWASTQGYRLVIERRLGLEALGIFAAGFSVVGGIFAALESVVSSFYQASFFQKVSGANEGPYEQKLESVWAVGLFPYFISAAYMVLLSPFIAKMFLGANFQEHLSDWLPMVALSETARLIFNLLGINYHGKKQTKKLVAPQVVSTAITISLMVFMPDLESKTIVAVIFVGHMCGALVLLFSDLEVYRISNLFRTGLKSILLAGAFFAAGSVVVRYDNNWIGFILITLLGLIFSVPYLKTHLRKEHG